MIDRRKKFKDVPWQQGYLLLTNNTSRWSKEQRDECDDEERHIAFAHFTPENEGRSREFVYRFSSHDECAAAVAAHNTRLTESLFYVVGEHKDQTAYYCGWWHTYGEPLFVNGPILEAKKMRRANANRVRRRLENPKIWGGKWRLVSVL